MTIPVGYETIPYLAITVHGIASGLLIASALRRKRERTKRFPVLFASNLVAFAAAILFVPGYWTFTQGIDFLAFIAYTTLVSYVLAVEIPGYLLLSRFDDSLSSNLQNMRRDIISLNYPSGKSDALESKVTAMKSRLKELFLDDVVEHFVSSYKRMNQVDKTLYDITLKELGEVIQDVSNRSKHPFPKLIEILSLAGISFLIGQFLNHFLP